jgi:thiamine transport system permease protein
LNRHFAVADHALLLATCITGLLLQPFFLRMTIPVLRDSHQRFAPLAATLRLSPARQILVIHLPRARREIAEAAGLVAALAAGEMSVLALLAPPDRPSLPVAVQSLIGAYRTDQAMAAALVLVVLAASLYVAISALGGQRARIS